MKRYKVVTTPELEKDVKSRVHYIAKNLGNPLDASRVWDDYKDTRKELKKVAGSLQDPDSIELKIRGLKRIRFDETGTTTGEVEPNSWAKLRRREKSLNKLTWIN